MEGGIAPRLRRLGRRGEGSPHHSGVGSYGGQETEKDVDRRSDYHGGGGTADEEAVAWHSIASLVFLPIRRLLTVRVSDYLLFLI
jgi:hypothetical protein